MIYSIKKEQAGQKIILRPLPNAKDLKNNVYSVKIGFDRFSMKWKYMHFFFALVNDELVIFKCGETIFKYVRPSNDPKIQPAMDLHIESAFEIGIEIVQDLELLRYEIKQICDNKFEFTSTNDKREYIKNLLTETQLDLLQAVNEYKRSIANNVIKFPDKQKIVYESYEKTLGQIFEEETKQFTI